MQIAFVHGWGVRSTETYGNLPERLERELGVVAEHIYLGKYVSFDDEVSLDDLSLALDAAVREKGLSGFACITHSTGGPLIRNWLSKFAAEAPPLRHLIMLAPANHGSALAQLGKGRLSRIKSFLEAGEPGQRILDWLELGSEEQWALNRRWLDYEALEQGFFPFVITGEGIDRKLYDHLNSYTGEPGGDGVVRVAAANMNYEYVRLEQGEGGELSPVSWRRSPGTALRILPGVSHSGPRMGIMGSVGFDEPHAVVEAIRECLAVQDEAAYQRLREGWQQANRPEAPHSMVVFRVVDERGDLLQDYDLLFTAGEEASPDQLPRGFFRDRQRNSRHAGRLSYFLDSRKLAGTTIGFELTARPEAGLVYYETARIAPARLEGLLHPNETLMLEVVLRRRVDRNCFQFTKNRQPERITKEPSGLPVGKAA